MLAIDPSACGLAMALHATLRWGEEDSIDLHPDLLPGRARSAGQRHIV